MHSLLAYADFAELQSDIPALVAQTNEPDTASGIREKIGTGAKTASAEPCGFPEEKAHTGS